MSDDDMEDYGFEYSDEEVEEEDVDIENQYYNSKGLLEGNDQTDALKGFQEVVKMEPDKAEWGFKALKQIVKIHFKLGNHADMLKAYSEMLSYTKSAVTRNQSEKKINSLSDHVSQSSDMKLLQDFYSSTLSSLAEANNERLWFKTQLKLCGLWFKLKEFSRMHKILKELHRACQNPDGTEDLKKGTQLLEVYALEIQMYTEQKDTKRLKQLYQKALTVKSAIPHPRIMGIIRECGGKMHMHERIWSEATTDFFEDKYVTHNEGMLALIPTSFAQVVALLRMSKVLPVMQAFKNYDEAGAVRRIHCLKYLVLANMLMESSVDPFDAQEAKPYKSDGEVLAMTNLVNAYQENNIKEFEKILRTNKRTIYDDPFIRNYIEDLLKNIRTQVVLNIVQPYTRIRIPFISKHLNIPEHDVEQLLVSLILDNRIRGHIDQVNHLLELGDRSQGKDKYEAIDKWAKQLNTLHTTVINKLQA